VLYNPVAIRHMWQQEFFSGGVLIVKSLKIEVYIAYFS
jgi:hypothetical protein